MKLEDLQLFLDELKAAYAKADIGANEVDILFVTGESGFDIADYVAMVDEEGVRPPRTLFHLEPYEDEEVE